MKILITGSSGQLGTDTLAELILRGHAPVALTSEELDITDAEAVASRIEAEAPDVIVNCAGYTAVDKAESDSARAHSVNSDGVRNLAVAAKKAGSVIIHISTDFVFDGKSKVPYVEDAATAPLGVYGSSKLEGEKALGEVLSEHIIIRTSWLYSAHGNNFVRKMLKLARARESLKVVSDQLGSPTWSVDLARAITVILSKVEAVRSGKEHASIWGVYGYSNRGVTSWYDLATAAIEEARATALGVRIICKSIEPIPTAEYPTPAVRPAYSALDTEKIERVFGVLVPDWKESLREMIKEVVKIEAKHRQTEVKSDA